MIFDWSFLHNLAQSNLVDPTERPELDLLNQGFRSMWDFLKQQAKITFTKFSECRNPQTSLNLIYRNRPQSDEF